MKVWSKATHKLLRVFSYDICEVLSVNISNNNKYIITGCEEVIRIWVIESGELFKEIIGNNFHYNSIKFTNDSKFIILAGYNKMIDYYSLKSYDDGDDIPIL